MSRHRAVRNMNINEELDDGAFSEEDEHGFELDPDDERQFHDALDKVYEVFGYQAASGIPDTEVEEIVYNNYFDVNKSLDELYRRQAAEARRGLVDGIAFTRLSTISERTERTEQSPASQHSGPWPSRQELLADRRPPSTPTTSSYGQVLQPSASTFGLRQTPFAENDTRTIDTTSEDYGQLIENDRIVDPNDIHPSPSLSAIRQLEIRTPSPSPSRSASTIQAPPQQRGYQASGHTVRGHGVKSSSSISSLSALRQPAQVKTERSLPRTPRSAHSQSDMGASQPSSRDPLPQEQDTPKKSKLASLASSRKSKAAPSESSVTTTSTYTIDTVATYPALRPRSLTSRTSVSNVAPEPKDEAHTPPKLDRQKERLKLLALARDPSPIGLPVPPPLAPSTPAGSEVLSLKSIPSETPSTPKAKASQVTAVPVAEGEQPAPPENEPVVSDKPASVAERPALSKLAQLAQAKAVSREHTSRQILKPRILNPPFAETKYLKPAYNNSSMTTAITTYTQTVDNMVAMSRADLPPSYPLEGKQSKLALKARSSHKKPAASVEDAQREALDRARSHAQSLLYGGNLSASRAEPSSFASLLVNDRDYVKQPKAKSEPSPEQKAEQRAEKKAEERLLRRMRKEALLPMHLLNPAVLQSTAFAFDVPSPDDVVLNARRGTALGSGRHSMPRSKDVRNRSSAA